LRGNGGIVPAVIEDELATVVGKGTQVGVGGVDQGSVAANGIRQGLADVEGIEAPVGIVVDHVGKVAGAELLQETLTGSVSEDPGTPAVGTELAAGLVARKQLGSMMPA
jgi:hypothetical protein